MAMDYELHALGLKADGVQYRIPDFNPVRDRHRLRGYQLVIKTGENFTPYVRAIGDRYVLKVRKSRIEFYVTYAGVQKMGLDDAEKYLTLQVLEHMRQRFADRALPLLIDTLSPSSPVRQLAQFKDLKSNKMGNMILEALG